ncbi:LOW QUALITY PROTEIN: uncharacterized protein ACLA_071810 [Aspergillus clavatus NRRL 1]|uniref:NADH-ubiquinone reductase complex 1 MLRQ subunit n=1 Tax=Aspergillus clavatus (strain ATCC 1007 / CBS 513.65 / DSM 816 / NCTC 3887 / NRRL 1 / QM 1276 / 107) TaxID=344612 RepID=A1C6X7_ASPCL|nr:LOW QUALITY PROTEIN: uncharacterized protein ACLA_071810 [Aspergillus clavatus NRRL 1]EAW14148.1 conserved hypothetical protein [Aspergillus clavatus NRRL 1]
MRQDFLNTRANPELRGWLLTYSFLSPSKPSVTTLPPPLPNPINPGIAVRHHHVRYSCHEDAGHSAFCFPCSSHTISQRLRTLKRVPPELIPLGIVLGVAVGAAIYSSTHKLLSDKTLRLYRNKPEDRNH